MIKTAATKSMTGIAVLFVIIATAASFSTKAQATSLATTLAPAAVSEKFDASFAPLSVSTTSAKSTKSTKKASKKSKSAQAKSLLNKAIKTYPILEGATVEIGDAKGYQAIAYYRTGRIIISKNHRASLTKIINHEVWHIIDYRDNGTIDWGEKLPPANKADYRTAK